MTTPQLLSVTNACKTDHLIIKQAACVYLFSSGSFAIQEDDDKNKMKVVSNRIVFPTSPNDKHLQSSYEKGGGVRGNEFPNASHALGVSFGHEVICHCSEFKEGCECERK